MYIHPIYQSILENKAETPEWYVDTDDLQPSDHFEIQAVVQKYVDGAVSKTINMPEGTTPEQLSSLTLEYIHDLKGVTVYVDGSREGQILNKVPEEDVIKSLKANKANNHAGRESVECTSGMCERL
jgi:ribonucleoside-diphosphate reductase alpha chain